MDVVFPIPAKAFEAIVVIEFCEKSLKINDNTIIEMHI